ncbi:MAG TPA: hypothetical protein VIL07_06440 [Symbiobacteriaceae bacterium]
MEVADLAALLAARRYREARHAAENLLRRGDLTVLEQAQTYLSLSYSLAALHLNQEALGPAELAVHYSRMTPDYDLLGRALYHLAELCADLALHKRALACLEQYFRQMPLYQRARALEGRAFHLAAVCHRNMWRESKAAEYFRKAYQWHLSQGLPPDRVEPIRAELIWQWLRIGQLERAAPLLAQSQQYVAETPQDVRARISLCNNLAYKAYLESAHPTAAARAEEAVRIIGATAAQKACAYLTLHYTARATGRRSDAVAFGMLARMQAILARRIDLERELTRSLLSMQDHVSLPHVEALLQSLRSQPDMPGNSQTAVE